MPRSAVPEHARLPCRYLWPNGHSAVPVACRVGVERVFLLCVVCVYVCVEGGGGRGLQAAAFHRAARPHGPSREQRQGHDPKPPATRHIDRICLVLSV